MQSFLIRLHTPRSVISLCLKLGSMLNIGSFLKIHLVFLDKTPIPNKKISKSANLFTSLPASVKVVKVAKVVRVTKVLKVVRVVRVTKVLKVAKVLKVIKVVRVVKVAKVTKVLKVVKDA